MAEPPEDSDPIASAPTQVGRGRESKHPRDLAESPARADADVWADPLEPTLVRRGERPASLEGSPVPATVTPEVPDRYAHLGTELGRGGIGRVTIAVDRHLDREVAIKELLPAPHAHPDDTASDRTRFLREARITGQLEHPSIVPVYELGQRDDGSLYYSMKLVRGRTLRKALDEAHSFGERMALLRHFVDLANAIAYAHSRGVVHRDIKPENVMLGEFGETVVLDWGLAKYRQASPKDASPSERAPGPAAASSETMAGEVVGTPAYMSPEQAEGQIDAVDERSDVWSLGAVLFEILTGKAPFKGKTIEKVLLQVITADFEPVRLSEEDAPPDLSAIAEKALSKDPDQRYRNARALVDDVIAFQNGRQVGAYDYTAWELIKKFVREHRTATLASILITIAIVTAGISTFAAYRRAVAEQTRAETAEGAAVNARRLAERNERRAHDILSTALVEKARQLTKARDFGSAGVFAAAAMYNSPYFETSPFRYPDLEGRATDATGAAQLSLRSALYEVMVGRQMTLAGHLDTGRTQACAFDVFADGARLLSSDADGRYVEWNLETRSSLRAFEGPKCPRQVEVAPDQKTALVRSQDGRAFLMDLQSGALRPVQPGDRPMVLRAALFNGDGTELYLVESERKILRLSADDLSVLAQAEMRAPRTGVLDPSGRWLAVGTRWGEVAILDARTLRLRYSMKDHRSTMWALAFDANGRRLAAGGYEGYVVVHDLEAQKPVARLPGDLPIFAVTFSPDSQHLISVGFEHGKVWHISEQAVMQTYRLYSRGLRYLDLRPTNHEVITAGYGPHLQIWRFDRPLATRYVGHAKNTQAFAAQADGRKMATSDRTGRIRVWTTKTGDVVRELQEPSVWDLAFADDALWTISSRGRVARWPADGPSVEHQTNLPTRSGSQVGISATIQRVAWTGAGAEIVVYDTVQNRIEHRLSDLNGQASEVTFSHDGQQLAAADKDGRLVVWRMTPPTPTVIWQRAQAHEGIISGLSFRPDGTMLASSGADGTIRLWRAHDGTPLAELTGHQDWVNDIDFSPDGHWLISGADDATARLWSVDGRRPVVSMAATSQVNAVGFIPGSGRIVVGRDGTFLSLPVHLDMFERPVGQLLEDAQQSAGLRLDGFELKTLFAMPPASP